MCDMCHRPKVCSSVRSSGRLQHPLGPVPGDADVRGGWPHPVGAPASILYYTILYYTILYYTILYYTVLYYIILYYTIIYYIIYSHGGGSSHPGRGPMGLIGFNEFHLSLSRGPRVVAMGPCHL